MKSLRKYDDHHERIDDVPRGLRQEPKTQNIFSGLRKKMNEKYWGVWTDIFKFSQTKNYLKSSESLEEALKFMMLC